MTIVVPRVFGNRLGEGSKNWRKAFREQVIPRVLTMSFFRLT
jgi:hypothetical protein